MRVCVDVVGDDRLKRRRKFLNDIHLEIRKKRHTHKRRFMVERTQKEKTNNKIEKKNTFQAVSQEVGDCPTWALIHI
jgi:hypothetical protein